MNLVMRVMKVVFALCLVTLFVSCNNVSRDEKVVAKVGDDVIYLSEVEYMLKSIPAQQQNVLGKEGSLKKAFDVVLEQKIMSYAGQKYLGSSQKIADMLEKTSKRDLSLMYQQYMYETLGYTDNELRVYYNNHKDEFKKDTISLSYSEARKDVAAKMKEADSKKELQALYEQRKDRYASKEKLRLGYIQFDNPALAADVYKKISTGGNFDSLAAVYSIHSSGKKKGDLGWVDKGQWKNEISNIEGIDSILFDPSNRLKKGEVSKLLNYTRKISDKIEKEYFVILKVTGYSPRTIPGYDKIKKALVKEFMQDFRKELMAQASKPLYEKYGLKLVELPKPDAKKYYQENKKNYMTTKGYKLYQIEMSDSTALAQLKGTLKDLNSFKAIAAEKSENIESKKLSGDLGVIKQGHCLPYGIGMAPMLFAELNKMEAGNITNVIYVRDSKKFNLFYLEKIILPVVKPYDRVKAAIEVKLEKGGVEVPLDTNTVLVTMKEKPLFYEKDVLKLKEEVPVRQRSAFPRTRLLEFLINWKLMSNEAKELNIDQTSDYLSLSRLRKADLWANEFKTKLFMKNLAVPNSILEKTYADNKTLFGNEKFEKVEREVAILSLTPDSVFAESFENNKAKYKAKDGETWKDYKAKIFKNNSSNFREKAAAVRLLELRNDANVRILDERFEDKDLIEKQMQEARKLFDARKWDSAKTLLQQIYNDKSAPVDYRAEASLKYGQLMMEIKKYDVAAKSFKDVYTKYPKYKDAYKAMFMEGFLYYEHVKDDNKAKALFSAMIAQYPKTDLTDDAKALLEDLDSGRQKLKNIIEKATKEMDKQSNETK